MKLPFSTDEFLKVFELYNRSIWPLQGGFYLLAIFAILAAFSKLVILNKIIPIILSFFWIWMGVVYHIIYFAEINKAAFIFGIAFITQGILFLYFAFIRKNSSFQYKSNLPGAMGIGFILFALIIYPFLGYSLGHVYPASPTFGLPCPTTIFTLGLLLWSNKKVPTGLLFIPMIWTFIGFSAAFSLGINEDIGLLMAGILFTAMLIIRKHSFA